ncbi:hypothetical protein CKM354_000399400 [Cercospora kikuchii]|uniref:Uncharacterized protein n=1 Tax=Cercospora kikuchii TaxID=84275 RepID=A0A9P3FFP6_9PEZI|nr:uncharacterized protein CKM354_000399400 [Cercospora kikuchii]GIZ40665.1 hypothetical protein CKM354_000399400 [Cercospora kikuchii]
MHHVLRAGLSCLAIYLLYSIAASIQLYLQRRAFKRANGCESPPQYPLRDPFGLGFITKVIPAAKRQELLPYFDSLHQRFGKTFSYQPWFGRGVLFSVEPENVKYMSTTNFEDWGSRDARQEGVGELLGDGIFTTDGAFWAHSRALIRPQFDRAQVSEQVEPFESTTVKLIRKIPSDGRTVDLQKLFHKFTMDTSAKFLTGTSTNSLDDEQAEEAQKFMDAFDYAMEDAVWRVRLGKLYWFRPDRKAPAAIKYVRDYVRQWVDRAVAYRDSLAAADKIQDSDDTAYIFINELAKQKEVDATRIHNETLNVLLAGRDTTAGVLSHMWYILARRPDVWEKLRDEVDALQGEPPTYVKLKEMRYMRNCIKETLRLYPSLPIIGKRAVKDTILPRGGGPHGDKPIFVPKGTNFTPSLWSLHRDKDVYGADAEDFRPERWNESLRPYWSYLPFGGGPRVCLGQQYAQSQAMYVTTRLMQHFDRIEPRDSEVLRHRLSPTLSVNGGTKVAFIA